MKKQKIFFLTLFCVLQSFVSSFAQTNGWYKAKEIGNKTWVIKEPGFDENMYLIEGRDSSLLIDTGFGMGNLRDFVKKHTSKPLIVVNTHSHPDHTGGNYQFPVVHIGTNDLELAKPLLDRNVTKQIVMQALGSIQIADSLKFPASENPNTTLIPVNDNRLVAM